jgi:hypothetical protein
VQTLIRPRRILASAGLAAGLVGASLALPGTAALAAAPSETPYAFFQTTPVAAAPQVDSAARIYSFPGGGSTNLGYAGLTLQTVTNPATKTVLLQTVNLTSGALVTSVDVSGLLDTVDFGTSIDDYGAGQVLKVYLRGKKDGKPVLVQVVAGKGTLAEAVATRLDQDVVDLDRVVALGAAGTGLLAISSTADGGYEGQRVSYAFAAVGDATALPFPAAGARSFVIDSSYGNVVSLREGHVDVVSLYAPEKVDTADVSDLGAVTNVELSGTSLAVADADGDTVLLELGFTSAPTVVGTAHVAGGITSMAYVPTLDELWVAGGSDDSLRRFAGDADADGDLRVKEQVALDGIDVLPGSLDAATGWGPGVVFLAKVDGHVYRYASAANLGAKLFRWEGNEVVGALTAAKRGGTVTLSFAAQGTGSMSNVWEYSLDGGTSWAARDADWTTAVADRGSYTTEPTALPKPLDGIAPVLRTSVDPDTVFASSNYSSSAYGIAFPDYAYDALWRVRVTNQLGSAASTPQRVTLNDAGDTAVPTLTRHPASVTIAAGRSTTLSAAATGDPAPTVQWQSSTDGSTWADIDGATETTLTVSPTIDLGSVRYRAVFTNTAGTATTQAAIVRVTAPEAPKLGAAVAGAVVVDHAELAYDLSTYSDDWLQGTAGDGVTITDKGGFDYSDGHGWIDPDSGQAQVVWNGAGVYRPYGGLHGLYVAIANPYLAVAADGHATLTADVAWNNGGGMYGEGSGKVSDGFKRVIIATFAQASLTADGKGAATFAGTPEWDGRNYVKPGLADATVYPSSFPASLVDYVDDGLRGWFLASGNSRDPEKAPSPMSATLSLTTDAASSTGSTIDPIDPLGNGKYPFIKDKLPSVTTAPESVEVKAGDSATLTAEATGYPAPSVRWQRLDGTTWADISGATSGTLELAGLKAGVSTVRAVFANRAGEVITDAVTVTVASTDPGTGPGTELAPLTATPVPKLAGAARVGGQLTAQAGTWAPAGVALSYQWLRGDAPIAGATRSTYVLQAADLGKLVSVRVTGTLSGYASSTQASAKVKVQAGELTLKGAARIKGTARVGRKLTAVKPILGQPGVAYTYQWFRNGKAISGKAAKKATYALKAKDKGKRIRVKVTVRKAGYATTTSASKATAPVKKR